jgi:WD40 repeat protein
MDLQFLDRGRLRVTSDRPTVYDWRTGKALDRSAEPKGPVHDRYAVSPDGRLVAAPDWPGVIRLYDAATGAEVRRLDGHTVLADPIVFSADGTRLYSRGHDQTVRGWDVAAGKALWTAEFGNATSGDQLAVSPDGKRVAAAARAGEGGPVQVWDAATGKAGPRFAVPGGSVGRLAFSPDRAVLAGAGGAGWGNPSEPGWIVLWDLATGTVRRTLTDPTGYLICVAFTPDGRSVVTGGLDGAVRVWELATGQERRAFKGHQALAYTLAVSPDGRHVASASPDVPTLVWDLYGSTDKPPTGAEGKALLADLRGDAAVAFTVIRRLAAHPAAAVPLLRAHLKPVPATDPKRIGELIKALDADRFAAREQAAADLAKLADEAEPAVRAALAAKTSAEARERLTQLLPKVTEPTQDRRRELRAVEALEVAGTPEALALLDAWAKDPKLRISRDAAAARGRGR